MTTALSIAAGFVAVLWLPILGKFFRAWRDRRNPVSLAIGLIIALMVYLSVLVVLVASFKSSFVWAVIVGLLFDFGICVNFYIAFRIAEKRFGAQRQVDKVEPLSAGTKPPATRPKD